MKKYVSFLFLALAIGLSVAQASDVAGKVGPETICGICFQPDNLIALHGYAVDRDGAHVFHKDCLTCWTYRSPHSGHNKCTFCQKVLEGADAQYLPTPLKLPCGFIMPVGDISVNQQLEIAILGNCSIRTRNALAVGANVNFVDNEGFTPLHMAALYGHLEVVTVLLGADGINVNAVDNRGSTALQIAEAYSHDAVANAIKGWIIINPAESNRGCVIS